MDGNKTLLCVAVGVDTMPEALRLVERESRRADLIEVRLDYLADLKELPYRLFFTAASVPLLFTLRPEWEGGHFGGPEAERIEILSNACEAGAAYVDCELRAPEETRRLLGNACRRHGTKLILSYHDFTSTPSKAVLTDVLKQIAEQRADVGKIVTTAENHFDVLDVLALQTTARDLKLPLIAFCMGDAGIISRVATARLGGFMTYCASGSKKGTAPGQLTSGQLRDILALLD